MTTDPDTIRSYNEHAETYNQHVINPRDAVYHHYYEKPAIRTELPDLAGLSVINLGCGTGIDTYYLKECGAERVVGIDISSKMIAIARRDYPDVEFYTMDMEQMDFMDETFDIAYSSLAMHYVDDWTSSLVEIRRILKPGGLYVFSCHHPISDSMEWFNDEEKRSALLGKTTAHSSEEQTVYGDYLALPEDGIKAIKSTLGDIEIKVYHRPISKMIEHIIESGFTIEKLVEPQPIKELRKEEPKRYEKLTKIPTFMIWDLRK